MTFLKPHISEHLLWEFNLDDFDYLSSRALVIERVIQRGDLDDWRSIYKFYGEEEIRDVLASSNQLSPRDIGFTDLFLRSALIHAV